LALVDENAALLGATPENFLFASEYILKDINYGFFVYAYDHEAKKPLGFMLFTYEWSDWRNGLFFWLQSVHVTSEARKSGVFSEMSNFLDGYMKERGSCGIRLYYEKEHREKWAPIIKKLKLTESPFIFHVDNK
jgi:GNAT superfamily N-acetyltransferase